MLGFDRDQPAEAGVVGRCAERLGQRGDLDRVADRGAGAVGLEQLDVASGQPGDGERLLDDVGVAVDARREVADLALAVVVDGRALDDARGSDRRRRSASASRRSATTPTPLSSTVPADSLVERPAVRRRARGSRPRGTGSRRRAGTSMVTPPASAMSHSALSRLCTARWTATSDVEHAVCTLTDGPRRSSRYDTVGRQEVLVVAGVAQQEHADLIDAARGSSAGCSACRCSCRSRRTRRSRRRTARARGPTSPAPPSSTRGSGGAADP